jgi:hypothetical protein
MIPQLIDSGLRRLYESSYPIIASFMSNTLPVALNHLKSINPKPCGAFSAFLLSASIPFAMRSIQNERPDEIQAQTTTTTTSSQPINTHPDAIPQGAFNFRFLGTLGRALSRISPQNTRRISIEQARLLTRDAPQPRNTHTVAPITPILEENTPRLNNPPEEPAINTTPNSTLDQNPSIIIPILEESTPRLNNPPEEPAIDTTQNSTLGQNPSIIIPILEESTPQLNNLPEETAINTTPNSTLDQNLPTDFRNISQEITPQANVESLEVQRRTYQIPKKIYTYLNNYLDTPETIPDSILHQIHQDSKTEVEEVADEATANRWRNLSSKLKTEASQKKDKPILRFFYRCMNCLPKCWTSYDWKIAKDIELDLSETINQAFQPSA